MGKHPSHPLWICAYLEKNTMLIVYQGVMCERARNIQGDGGYGSVLPREIFELLLT